MESAPKFDKYLVQFKHGKEWVNCPYQCEDSFDDLKLAKKHSKRLKACRKKRKAKDTDVRVVAIYYQRSERVVYP